MVIQSGLLQKDLKVKHLLLAAVVVAVIYLCYNFFWGNAPALVTSTVRCDTCGIGITDLVRKVKKELIQLEDSMTHKNESQMFRLKDMGMEISFVVRQTASGKVGGSYEVLTVEGSHEVSNENVQKLTLHWETPPLVKDTSKVIVRVPLDPAFINTLKSDKSKKALSTKTLQP